MMGPHSRKNIPDKWKERLRVYIREQTGEDRDYLSATDFKTDSLVHLRFPDGSFALFRYAFCLVSAEDNEAAVFTEHCGYHIFSSYDLQIESLQSTRVDNG
jgi:hypothetical protein